MSWIELPRNGSFTHGRALTREEGKYPSLAEEKRSDLFTAHEEFVRVDVARLQHRPHPHREQGYIHGSSPSVPNVRDGKQRPHPHQ